MRKIAFTSQFEKDVKRAQKRGWEMQKLSVVILLLENGSLQDKAFKDHPLKGNYAGTRECHLPPDWLLVYQADEQQVILLRTGTHSDLFR